MSTGVIKSLSGGSHKVIPDRIEAGTFAVAAACVMGSELVIAPVVPGHLAAPADALRRMGCLVEMRSEGSCASGRNCVSLREGAMVVVAPPMRKGDHATVFMFY